ncbi:MULTISPECIES: DUF5908 family protein [unclassified Agarivorans]|uniref:DUF5908 family protein n=1 Tax=unclassified Agarivorans TaxID=2636026 RepID=UPI0026E12B9C|nr:MULTISPECIES: DUF5908 family protein [unclassified Agarivorans]MDO6686767.1 DUF5908 family protein [Agarivorans sp. 3_MG-2023]MDO6716503.1 DUF5908 family protein [Agarivorans sp. 2_MG-2023]
MAIEIKQLVIKSSIDNSPDKPETFSEGRDELRSTSWDEKQKQQLQDDILTQTQRYCDRAIAQQIKKQSER